MASQTLDGLRALERGLTAYHGLYRKYLHSVTEGNVTEVRAVLKKMEKLRSEMAQQYGQAREAIIAAVGGESRVQTGYPDLGGTFTIVLTDPVDNEQELSIALEGAIREVQMAIGRQAAEASRPVPTATPSRRELNLHPVIEAAAGKLFDGEHYPEATFAASKALLRLLRTKTGIDKELLPLVEEALAVKNPRLLFNANLTEADHDEQRGMFHLAEGVVLAVRCPRDGDASQTWARASWRLGFRPHLAATFRMYSTALPRRRRSAAEG